MNIENLYVNVTSFENGNTKMNFEVSKIEGGVNSFIGLFSCEYSSDLGAAIQQAYEYLKGL